MAVKGLKFLVGKFQLPYLDNVRSDIFVMVD